jgi:hypothetical protein
MKMDVVGERKLPKIKNSPSPFVLSKAGNLLGLREITSVLMVVCSLVNWRRKKKFSRKYPNYQHIL